METKDLITLLQILDNKGGQPEKQENIGKNIVIVDRGWVFVGTVEKSNDWITIENCQCIRRWGTTNGIGELAFEGPKSETKLEKMPMTKIPMRAVIGMVKCNESKW